jgi:hypothetical protein
MLGAFQTHTLRYGGVITHRELMTHHWAIYFPNAALAVIIIRSLSQAGCSLSTGCNLAHITSESLENTATQVDTELFTQIKSRGRE